MWICLKIQGQSYKNVLNLMRKARKINPKLVQNLSEIYKTRSLGRFGVFWVILGRENSWRALPAKSYGGPGLPTSMAAFNDFVEIRGSSRNDDRDDSENDDHDNDSAEKPKDVANTEQSETVQNGSKMIQKLFENECSQTSLKIV